MNKNKVTLLLLSLVILIQFTVSQNNTNSPYTRFGYGDISDANSGEQRAMGGVAFGARSPYSINNINPASYSSVDSTSFMFDISGSALLSRFTDPTGKMNTTNANLEYITMRFPLSKWLGFSAGMLPYSFTGYDFSTSDTLYTGVNGFDSIATTQNFNGTGGFSQVYAGISAKFFDHISVGINAYYMFGSINNYRNVGFSQSSGFTSTTQLNLIQANDFRFRYGLQVYNTFANKHDVTLGLIFEQKKRLSGNFSQITSGVLTDTVNYDKDFELPATFGVGLYYTYDKKLSVGLDYSMQQWKDAKYFGQLDTLNNRSKIALGVEYIPDPRGRSYLKRMRYRGGINTSDSYYKVNGLVQPKNFGISFGVGLPLKNSKTLLNASFEYGKIGSNTLLREDYLKFTFNACINENWFFKRKL